MEKEDAINQTLEQLHERRKQVVRLHKKGIEIMQIVALTGLSYPTVRAAIDLFDAGGWIAIRPALCGRGWPPPSSPSRCCSKPCPRMKPHWPCLTRPRAKTFYLTTAPPV